MEIFQHGIFFMLFVSVLSAAENFTCYHGEGKGPHYVPKLCPSRICIIFNAACGSYTSTTCYAENNPMKVVNIFKNATFLYNTSPQSTSFGYCTTSECNKAMGSLVNPIIIQSDPSSFDHLLAPSVKNEQVKKALQNGIKLPRGIAENETFKFVGQTFKTSKSPWITISVSFKNNTSMRIQINFDLVKSKLIVKTITSKTTKSKSLTWTNPTKRGAEITVTLKKSLSFYEVSVNDQDYQTIISNDKTINAITLITYGGAWTILEASITDSTTTKKVFMPMLPTFYSDLIQLNAAKIKGTSKTPKLVINKFNWDKTKTLLTILLPTVSINEMINYEFRKSDNPQSDLVKFQFQSMKFPPQREYAIFWKRENSIWSTSGVVFIHNYGPTRCFEYKIGIMQNSINLYCDDKNVHNITYSNVGTIITKTYQNAELPNPCSKKDPITRLLGLMPRITEYSF